MSQLIKTLVAWRSRWLAEWSSMTSTVECNTNCKTYFLFVGQLLLFYTDGHYQTEVRAYRDSFQLQGWSAVLDSVFLDERAIIVIGVDDPPSIRDHLILVTDRVANLIHGIWRMVKATHTTRMLAYTENLVQPCDYKGHDKRSFPIIKQHNWLLARGIFKKHGLNAENCRR